jgi:hypothetical protein
LVEKKGN